MECKSVIDILSSYLDGELSPSESVDVIAHLQGCAVCQKEQQQLRASWDLLSVIQSIEPSPDFKVRFWEKVREQEEKKYRRHFPRLIPALAGVIGVWVVGVGIGATLFIRSHAVSLSMIRPESSLAAAYLKRSLGGAL